MSTRRVSGNATGGMIVSPSAIRNKRFTGPVVRSNLLVVRGDRCIRRFDVLSNTCSVTFLKDSYTFIFEAYCQFFIAQRVIDVILNNFK